MRRALEQAGATRERRDAWTISPCIQPSSLSHSSPTQCGIAPARRHRPRSLYRLGYHDTALRNGWAVVAIGFEINPLYVDVAVRRWQAYTGARPPSRAAARRSMSSPRYASKAGGLP